MNAKKISEILQRYRQGDASSKEIEMVKYCFTILADKIDWHWQQGEKEILESDIEKRLLQSINENYCCPTKVQKHTGIAAGREFIAVSAPNRC